MSIGDKTLKKKDLKAEKMREVSSPAKVFQSRASKPSAVEAIATADATDAGETQALANELKAKMNELLAALKK